jgi:hypothetical protein
MRCGDRCVRRSERRRAARGEWGVQGGRVQTEKPIHARAMAARVGRLVRVSTTLGRSPLLAPPLASKDGRGGRGEKTRSFGAASAARLVIGAGLSEGAGMSRAKQMRPLASATSRTTSRTS